VALTQEAALRVTPRSAVRLSAGAYPEIWIRRGGGRKGGSRPLPYLFRPVLSPLPIPFPPLFLEVGPLNPARGSGERCKLPQRGLQGAEPQPKLNLVGGNNFNDFPESQLTKFQTFMPGNLH